MENLDKEAEKHSEHYKAMHQKLQQSQYQMLQYKELAEKLQEMVSKQN